MRSPVRIWSAAPQKPPFSIEKSGFYFAFHNFLACLKFEIRALTTEQATDREKWASEGVLPPEARCFFSLPFPVLSSKQSPASSPESAGPVFFTFLLGAGVSERSGFEIQVLPLKGADLAAPQAGGQFQKEQFIAPILSGLDQ